IVPTGGGSFVVPAGTPTVVDMGVHSPANYSVVSNDYGAGAPITRNGTQNFRYTKVAASPGANQYTFNPATSTYTFGPASGGAAVYISYSYQFSLYYFQHTQAAIIPGAPYQVSTDNESYFFSDQGVT